MSKLPSNPLVRRRMTRSLFIGGPDGKEHRDWQIGHDVHIDDGKKEKKDHPNERKAPNSNRGW